MTDKKTTDFGTAGRSEGWDLPDSLSREQQAQVDKLMASIKHGRSGLDHHWGRDAGVRTEPANTQTGNDSFTFSTDERGVTVNGKHYRSLDEVPLAERGRIEVLQRQFAPDSELMKQMQAGGGAVSTRASTSTRTWRTKHRSGTKTTHETSTFGSPETFDANTSHESGGEPFGFTTQVPGTHASPGEVPRKSGLVAILQVIVVLALVTALVLAAQSAGLF